MAHKVMDPDSLNANVKKTVYAVRGELYLRASELQKEGKKVKSFEPFRLLSLTEAQYPLPHLTACYRNKLEFAGCCPPEVILC
jgi:hypothetical protein